jgi:hypothetical protein
MQASLDRKTITGLIASLKVEKKKRSCGKRLNLIREEDLVGLMEITAYPLEPKSGVSSTYISVN